MLGRRGRPPTLSPPRNYRRRLNFGEHESEQNERRGDNSCAPADKCRRGEGICLANCPHNDNECLGEDDHQLEDESRGEEDCGGEHRDGFNLIADEDDSRVEDHDAGHASDNASDYTKKSGRRGGRGRDRGRGRSKRKCRTRGAAAPPPWIVDPRPHAEEENINDEDLREEEFFPSRQIEAYGQEIGCFSPPELLNQSPEPETQVLLYPGYHFVLDLVLACRCFLADPLNENNDILKIFQYLKSTDAINSANHYSEDPQRAVMAFDSLENLAARCSQAEENIAVTCFIFMLNAIQLRCKVIKFVLPFSCSV